MEISSTIGLFNHYSSLIFASWVGYPLCEQSEATRAFSCEQIAMSVCLVSIGLSVPCVKQMLASHVSSI